MVQCEMCGKNVDSPNRVKIEGAKLDVCDDCTEFGTKLETTTSTSTTSKYSTASESDSGESSSSSSNTGRSTGSSGGTNRGDMYDEMDELVQDYDDLIRQGREDTELSQEELAKQLNEKASLIRKLEHGDTLPSDDVQRKLERALDVDLSAGESGDDAEWESEAASGSYTLGDVVERKE